MICNVELKKLRDTIDNVKKNPAEARKTAKIEGICNIAEGDGPQFEAEIIFEKGKMNFEMAQPTFLGGDGSRPSPMHYCLFALASCYAATFTTVAAMEDFPLDGLKVAAENRIDFSKVLGLSDSPPIEGVKITAYVKSDAPESEIKRIEQLAKERCPVTFCLTNPINLETSLVVQDMHIC